MKKNHNNLPHVTAQQLQSNVPLEHHVSVSRTVPLRYAQIDMLIAALQHQLRRQSRCDPSPCNLCASRNAGR